MKTKSLINISRAEAREIVEECYGREYMRSKLVHHIDKNPLNNDLGNLIVVSRSEHKIIHNFNPKKGERK